MKRNYRATDFSRELSINETLRFFRALFFTGSVPNSFKFMPIYSIYKDLVKNNDKFTVSTWLTVMETCRHADNDALADLLKYSKD
jgi:hypothetical protein